MQHSTLFTGIYILGLALGVLCTFTITVIWLLFYSSVIEFFYESFSRKYIDQQPKSLEEALKDLDAQAVIISDLHVDRWNTDDSNLQTLATFVALLKKYPHVTECIINGDLADFPEKSASSILRRDLGALDMKGSPAMTMISHCIAVLSEANIPLSIVLGNHDLSLHGLRNLHTSKALLPGNIKQVWDGTLLLNTINNKRISVEHGHRYDPLLSLYTAYRTLDLARNAQLDQASDFYDQLASSRHTHHKEGTTFSALHENIVKLRYRRAARFNRHRSTAVTFGHTHVPDRFMFNAHCVYVNTGSWEPDSGGYAAVATNKGEVWGPYPV